MKHLQLNIHDKPIKVSSELIIIHPRQEHPISRTDTSNLISLILPDSYAQKDETYTGYYEIWAENMQPKYGVITFRFKHSKSSITVERTNNIPILNELY